jgi:DNA-binding transcriptional regulator YdaS (Cro superfamily)
MSLIEEVVAAAGGRLELARAMGVSTQFVHQLLRGERPIPAKRCSAIEAVTGIPRARLRPDVFGAPAISTHEPAEAEREG